MYQKETGYLAKIPCSYKFFVPKIRKTFIKEKIKNNECWSLCSSLTRYPQSLFSVIKRCVYPRKGAYTRKNTVVNLILTIEERELIKHACLCLWKSFGLKIFFLNLVTYCTFFKCPENLSKAWKHTIHL